MKNHENANIKPRPDLSIFVVLFVAFLLLFALTACSTVTGAGKFLQGVGIDLEDMGEGTRERMGSRR